MAPVTQYVFAAMRSKTEHFTAGSHEWLPYSKKHTFQIITSQTPIYRFGQLSIRNRPVFSGPVIYERLCRNRL